MMFPSNRVRVLVSTQPVDFRKGHDGLAALVSSVLRKDPFTGTVVVFRSRRADRLNVRHVLIMGEDELAAALREEAARYGVDSRVTVQGDTRAAHGRVVRAMTLAQRAGFSRLVIATRQGPRGAHAR